MEGESETEEAPRDHQGSIWILVYLWYQTGCLISVVVITFPAIHWAVAMCIGSCRLCWWMVLNVLLVIWLSSLISAVPWYTAPLPIFC